MSRWL